MDRHHEQAVKQILAKLPAPHGLHRITVGGANDAHIHLAWARGPNRHHRGGLQKSQQFGLQRRGHFANLVQKQRAAICRCGRPLFVGNCPGKAAFHMAEHFGFQQILRNSAAVQRNKWPRRAGRIAVHRQRTQLFSSATFAGDEDRRHGFCNRGNLGMDPRHGVRTANKGRRVQRNLRRRCALGRGAARGNNAACIGDRIQQFHLIKRLDQKFMRARPHRIDGHVDRAVRRHHDHIGIRAQAQQLLHQVQPVFVGQYHVQQHQLCPGGAKRIQPFGGSCRRDYGQPGAGQDGSIQQHQRWRVFDQQDRRAGRGMGNCHAHAGCAKADN